MPIQRRPIFWATAAVVPEPRKESRIKSPGSVEIWNIRLMSLSGLGVENALSSNKVTLSFFPSCECPTSLFCHHDQAVVPVFSERYVFCRGTPLLSSPNQRRPSLRYCRYTSSMFFQQRPVGGVCFMPDGVVMVYI
ncbi:hypothetical protein SDC9_179021 [bioreactor metagenome]|uniref:Uncharacterized protein n=1 Tax=bioreactor metagenome TaxID=1076179 RepID=A0A645GXT5_9ZZZZ